MKPTEYRMSKIQDLLDVPEEKWDVMLKDLKAWLAWAKEFQEVSKRLSDIIPGVGVMPSAEFIWIDDGIVPVVARHVFD